MFTTKQIAYIKSLGLSVNFNNLSDDDYVNIEEKVADRLQIAGFDSEYNITSEGLLCESILDALPV